MIDKLRQGAIASTVDIFVRGKFKDRVCAAVDTIVGFRVIDMLVAILDNFHAPRDVSKCKQTLPMNWRWPNRY